MKISRKNNTYLNPRSKKAEHYKIKANGDHDSEDFTKVLNLKLLQQQNNGVQIDNHNPNKFKDKVELLLELHEDGIYSDHQVLNGIRKMLDIS